MSSTTNDYSHLARDPAIGAHVAEYLERALKELQESADGQASKLKPAINQVPLARIKRIMKQDSCDPAPRMISVSAILDTAYAALEFTRLLTLSAWKFFALEDKRNTLQAKDLRNAVYSSQCFDFLVDVLDMFEEGQASEHELTGSQRGPIQIAYESCMQVQPHMIKDPSCMTRMPP